MDFKAIFGHDVYVDDNRVGYVSASRGNNASIFFGGSKLGTLTSDGVIELKGIPFGHIEDNKTVFIRNKKAGIIDEKFDMRLDLKSLTKAMEKNSEE